MSFDEMLAELPTLTLEQLDIIAIRARMISESPEPALSAVQRAEIEDRLDDLDADPSLAVPYEGTMEIVKKLRANARAKEAANRRH